MKLGDDLEEIALDLLDLRLGKKPAREDLLQIIGEMLDPEFLLFVSHGDIEVGGYLKTEQIAEIGRGGKQGGDFPILRMKGQTDGGPSRGSP